MGGVVIGFTVIGTIIAGGYGLGRAGVLPLDLRPALSRFVFLVAAPCLLLTVLADADVSVLISPLLAVSALSAAAVAVVFVLVAMLVWRRRAPEATVGALASGYVNANNIGLPVAVYVLGDPAYSAPVILFQLVVAAPIALTVLDVSTRGRVSIGAVLLSPFKNPIVVASLVGALISVTGLPVPTAVLEPFRIVGGAAVPLMLIAFGMSLVGRRVLEPGSGRRDVLLATALKLVVMPLVAWLLGAFVFDLSSEALRAVVILAALPTAQNVQNYANRYGRGDILSRDAVFLTTLGALPVLLVVSVLLHA